MHTRTHEGRWAVQARGPGVGGVGGRRTCCGWRTCRPRCTQSGCRRRWRWGTGAPEARSGCPAPRSWCACGSGRSGCGSPGPAARTPPGAPHLEVGPRSRAEPPALLPTGCSSARTCRFIRFSKRNETILSQKALLDTGKRSRAAQWQQTVELRASSGHLGREGGGGDLAVQATRAQQRRVQGVRPVGRHQHLRGPGRCRVATGGRSVVGPARVCRPCPLAPCFGS